jgi:hypothetical protein
MEQCSLKSDPQAAHQAHYKQDEVDVIHIHEWPEIPDACSSHRLWQRLLSAIRTNRIGGRLRISHPSGLISTARHIGSHRST